MNKYGRNHDEVAAFIKAIKVMTPEQIKNAAADAAAYDAYDAAADAAAYAAYDAYDAYDAAADDAYDAAAVAVAWKFRWYFARAARALAIKHLIGKHGFTQAHYDLLTVKPLEIVMGKKEVLATSKYSLATSKYSFDRAQFSLCTDDVIKLSESGIISIDEARYLMGFNNGL